MAEDRRRPPKFSTETRKSDPRRTSDENFASFMGFLDERFYDVDRHACRVKRASARTRTRFTLCGAEWRASPRSKPTR